MTAKVLTEKREDGGEVACFVCILEIIRGNGGFAGCALLVRDIQSSILTRLHQASRIGAQQRVGRWRGEKGRGKGLQDSGTTCSILSRDNTACLFLRAFYPNARH